MHQVGWVSDGGGITSCAQTVEASTEITRRDRSINTDLPRRGRLSGETYRLLGFGP